MELIGRLTLARVLRPEERGQVADLLSTIAADMTKGAGGFGIQYELLLAEESDAVELR